MAEKPNIAEIASKATLQAITAAGLVGRKVSRSVTIGIRMRKYEIRQPTEMIDAFDHLGDWICRTESFVNSSRSRFASSTPAAGLVLRDGIIVTCLCVMLCDDARSVVLSMDRSVRIFSDELCNRSSRFSLGRSVTKHFSQPFATRRDEMTRNTTILTSVLLVTALMVSSASARKRGRSRFKKKSSSQSTNFQSQGSSSSTTFQNSGRFSNKKKKKKGGFGSSSNQGSSSGNSGNSGMKKKKKKKKGGFGNSSSQSSSSGNSGMKKKKKKKWKKWHWYAKAWHYKPYCPPIYCPPVYCPPVFIGPPVVVVLPKFCAPLIGPPPIGAPPIGPAGPAPAGAAPAGPPAAAAQTTTVAAASPAGKAAPAAATAPTSAAAATSTAAAKTDAAAPKPPADAAAKETVDISKLQKIPAGGTTTINGKTFGIKKGTAVVQIGELALPVQVGTWKDTAVTITLPQIGVAKGMPTKLFLVNADGKVAGVIDFLLVAPKAADATAQAANNGSVAQTQK